MFRPLAVLVVLAVLVAGGAALLPDGGASSSRMQPISAPPPGRHAEGALEGTRRMTSSLAEALERSRRAPRASRSTGRSGPGSTTTTAATDEDFSVTLDELTPAVIPERGPVLMRGTVTNQSEDAWRDLNIHPFVSYSPMTTAREVEVAAESDPEMYVGERIISAGAFDDRIRELAPGDTAPWSVRVPRDALEISGEPGVYWIGVHVLGATEAGRDGQAHGRARSLITLPDPGMRRVPTSIVVPVREQVRRTGDGRVARTGRWTRLLEADGRLANLARLAWEGRGTPLTWLVDPAVLDAATQLADGNPPRSLGTPDGDGDDGDETATEGTDSPGETDQTEDPEDPEEDEDPLRGLAGAWLDDMREQVADQRVLGLPYGDLDVSAAVRHAPDLYRRARDLANRTFADQGVEATSATVSLNGTLSPAAVALAAQDSHVFLPQEALPVELAETETRPATVTVGENRVAVYADAVARGGPGPDDPMAPVALRQRILAEAAVRSLSGDRQPLQVVLPANFDPGPDGSRLLRGLEQPFVGLAPAGVDTAGAAPEVERLRYSARHRRRELDRPHLGVAQEIVRAGSILDGILPRTDTVADRAAAEALNLASYHSRPRPLDTQRRGRDALLWLRTRLDRIDVEAPSFVILSAESGPFAVTISNGLDQPVSVRIRAHSEDDLVIRAPEQVELPPASQQTVRLTAESRSIGVHSVELFATDERGTPIGAADRVSVRTNQAGTVIWVVLGIGLGMLFLAIPVRLWRRWRGRQAA